MKIATLLLVLFDQILYVHCLLSVKYYTEVLSLRSSDPSQSIPENLSKQISVEDITNIKNVLFPTT